MSESNEPASPQPIDQTIGGQDRTALDWAEPDEGEVRSEPKPAPEPPHTPDPPPVEGDDEPAVKADAEDDPIGDEPAESDIEDDGPEFWSKEDKAFWKQVPPELRPILRKYEQQRIEFANKKAEEAAGERKKAAEEATKAAQANDQYAMWWKQNEAKFHQTFVDRWANVDWNKLSAENPAEWARLSQMRQDEGQMLMTAKQQADAAARSQAERAEQEHQQARMAEHQKLAKKYPKEFGTPETAQRTYDVLSKYVFSQLREDMPDASDDQIAARVNSIYEAAVVKLARKAYKYDQLQAKAQGVTNPKPPEASASKTPTRVVPGAARTAAANQANEATRQAVERLKSGEKLSRDEAALAFR